MSTEGSISAATRHSPKRSRSLDRDEDMDEVSYHWLDKGVKRPDGRVEHDLARLTIKGKSFQLKKGDFVKMWSHKDKKSSTWHSDWCSQVECMWEEPASALASDDSEAVPAKFRARWFYKKPDIVEMKDEEILGSISRSDLLNSMLERELVLSCQVDHNSIETISGPARVLSWAPDVHKILNTNADDTFVCRYRFLFKSNDDMRKIVMSYNPSSHTSTPRLSKRKLSAFIAGAEHDTPSSGSGDETNNYGNYRQAWIGEGEQSKMKGRIRIGPEHQVVVSRYSRKKYAASRKPALVWKKSAVTDSKLELFFDKAAMILISFAEANNLTMDDELLSPMSDAGIKLGMQVGGESKKLPSALANAAGSLSTKDRHMLRECNVDLLLECLHECDYNIDVATTKVNNDPGKFLTVWTQIEKDGFDSGARKYPGALRLIGNVVGSTKSVKEVVDYHYRFKIPQLFRAYQEKKREQAVRIMECIEARRVHGNVIHAGDEHAVANEQGDGKRKISLNWSESAPSDVTGVVEKRRLAAKELLLDIQREIGQEALTDITSAIISFHRNANETAKKTLLQTLKEHPGLHERLLGFLPKWFWK